MHLFRNIRVFAAAALPVVLFSLSSFAEEAAEEAEAGKEAGLPQFNPVFFPEQIFWLVVTFAILYVLMAFVALPRIAKTQGNRKRVLAAEIESARTANEAAKTSLVSVEKALNEARENAHAGVSEMLAKVAEEETERRAVQEKEISRKLHRAEEKIAIIRTAALEQIAGDATDFASAVVGKILGAQKRGTA
jgi:F-type H+-transporting ATPase subunit b